MNQIIEDFFAKENGNGESGEDLIKSGFVSIVGLPNAGNPFKRACWAKNSHYLEKGTDHEKSDYGGL